MPIDYIEPESWAGTSGEWQANFATGVLAFGPQIFGEHKNAELWPSQYGGHGGDTEFRANLAAMEQTKELLKALQPFAALSKELPADAVHGYIRLKVPIKALLAAVETLSRVMPIIKQNSIPYKPEGHL